MVSSLKNKEKLLPEIEKPHVVILGAGASKAAFPNGDRNGNQLPLMNDLVDVLGLKELLRANGIAEPIENFESLYSQIHNDPSKKNLLIQIENSVYNHFDALELPDGPTIYDYLVLSLRPKDVIATFNWDPLLMEAYNRNRHFAEGPDIRFLHGNIGIAYCPKDGAIGGPNTPCPTCSDRLKPTKLLYPVSEKNYSDNEFIKEEWRAVSNKIKNAFFLTIFGYSAPDSDVEAKKLLLDAWSSNNGRQFLETEFIDIKEKSYLETHWKDFYFSHHFVSSQNYHDSWIAKYPRRSCENIERPVLSAKFPIKNPAPQFESLEELREWFRPIIQEEDVPPS